MPLLPGDTKRVSSARCCEISAGSLVKLLLMPGLMNTLRILETRGDFLRIPLSVGETRVGDIGCKFAAGECCGRNERHDAFEESVVTAKAAPGSFGDIGIGEYDRRGSGSNSSG